MSPVPVVSCDMASMCADPRTVTARKQRTLIHFPVIAVEDGMTLTENGEVGTEAELIEQLQTMPRSLLVMEGAADWLAGIHDRFTDDPRWQWKLTEKTRRVTGTPSIGRATATVDWFGWKGDRGKHSHTHRMLDPVTFSRNSLDHNYTGTEPKLYRLLAWGVSIRDWAYEQGLDIRPTMGALGAQFLTDPRIYPDPRRKVPKAINQRVRENIPGNHYHVFARMDGRTYPATYIDQRRAHHYHARTLTLPNSNSLFAFGRFLTLEGTLSNSTWGDFHGLYYLRLIGNTRLPTYTGLPSHVTRAARNEPIGRFVFSNEITLLEDLGLRVHSVVAAWGSREPDTGLRKYAEWAEAELDRLGDPPWLKPILLSTYGVLATRPQVPQYVFNQAKKGDPTVVFTGRNRLHGLLVRATNNRKVEPGFANVLHRAMIEAATRAESLGLAHWLGTLGHKMLHIYADGVIVEQDDDRPLPLLPEPWRVKEEMSDYRPINEQAFTSGVLEKIPGALGRSDVLRVSRGINGRAPQRPLIEAGTGRTIYTKRKI